MTGGLSTEVFRKSTGMEQCTNVLGNHMVLAFGDTSLLVGVMDTEFLHGALGLAMGDKFSSLIFSTTVSVEDFNVVSKLSFNPCFEGFISIEGFILGAEKVQECKSGFVINKDDPVMFPSFRFNWRLPPEVGMDLIRKFLGTITFPFLRNSLSSCLCVHTRLAEEFVGVRGVVKLNAKDMLVLHKFTGSFD